MTYINIGAYSCQGVIKSRNMSNRRKLVILVSRIALILTLASTIVGFAENSQGVATPLIVRRLDALLAREFAMNQTGGVVLIARRDKPLFRRAYGLADIELGVPMRPNSVLRIGSITKQFTAVAILKLVQEGKIRLVDDVRPYVPGLLTDGQSI